VVYDVSVTTDKPDRAAPGPDHDASDLAQLFALVKVTRPEGAWPSLEKCQGMANLVIAMRPKAILEIGVCTGDSLIPMCLALKHLGTGKAFAVDPWDVAASVQGQPPDHEQWWKKAPHEQALDRFQSRLVAHGLVEICGVLRRRSDDVDPETLGPLGIVHIDGNHSDQAIRDVKRFAPKIEVGGWLILDDLDWPGGGVQRAYSVAGGLGFFETYRLGSGVVMQRQAMRA
jgi:predicted O-methyltransferase YrrM